MVLSSVAGVNSATRPTLPLIVMPTYQQGEEVQQSPGRVEVFGT